MEQKGTLNWREALHFSTQICKALEHAHSRGIVHRDIKPHNIMILKDGSVKVADFGIARISSAQNTLTREALGSVHYISPEQAKNHPGKNVITRAVGTEPSVEGDIYLQKLHRDDCLLLCSDGLSNVMADQEMLFEVAHGVRKSDCCQRLLRIAKNRGAPDNVTVAMALV